MSVVNGREEMGGSDPDSRMMLSLDKIEMLHLFWIVFHLTTSKGKLQISPYLALLKN